MFCIQCDAPIEGTGACKCGASAPANTATGQPREEPKGADLTNIALRILGVLVLGTSVGLLAAKVANLGNPPPAITKGEQSAPANFEDFYVKLRNVVSHRDQVGLRSMMSERFEWALDGYTTRDQAFKNIGNIIGWQKFWRSASLALSKPAQICRPHYCNDRPGYETFTKTPFPLEMLFAQGSDNQWQWSAVLGD